MLIGRFVACFDKRDSIRTLRLLRVPSECDGEQPQRQTRKEDSSGHCR